MIIKRSLCQFLKCAFSVCWFKRALPYTLGFGDGIHATQQLLSTTDQQQDSRGKHSLSRDTQIRDSTPQLVVSVPFALAEGRDSTVATELEDRELQAAGVGLEVELAKAALW